ncbi:MAG: ParB N-terminal domain-containing protein [Desulfobacterales bacterium]|jgi:hypothetical protein
MVYKVSEVDLRRLNQEDHSFRITTQRDKSSLRESIANLGVLVPPAVWLQPPSGFKIVSGFRRIQTCQRLGIQRIALRLIPEDTQPLTCVRMAVAENTTQRPLNLIETARAVRLVQDNIPDLNDLAAELTGLGLPSSRAILDKLERLQRLNADLQAAIVDGVVCLAVALETGLMPPSDQKAIWKLFTALPMSVSKQKEVLTLARDIAGRDHQTVNDVFQSDAIQAIMRSDEYDQNQKTASIRRHLRMVRYPKLSEAVSQYQTALASLKLDPHMRIDPPPGFEGDIFTLSLRFKRRRDLERAYRNLGAALENPAIESLFPH